MFKFCFLEMANPLYKIALFAVCLISVGIFTASLAGRKWTQDTVHEQHTGIWTYCLDRILPVGRRQINNKTVPVLGRINGCWDRGSGPFKDFIKVFDWTYVVRTFGCIAVLFGFFGIGIILKSLYDDVILKKEESLLSTAVVSLPTMIAGVTMAIALIVYGACIEKTDTGELGWSYIIGWVGVAVSLIGSILISVLSCCRK